MSSVNYLQKGKDINLCDMSTDFYKPDGAIPDLSSNTASLNLKSDIANLKPLTMNFAILDSGVLNIKWTYKD